MVYEWNLRNDGSWKAHIMRGTVKYEATFSATGALLKFENHPDELPLSVSCSLKVLTVLQLPLH